MQAEKVGPVETGILAMAVLIRAVSLEVCDPRVLRGWQESAARAYLSLLGQVQECELRACSWRVLSVAAAQFASDLTSAPHASFCRHVRAVRACVNESRSHRGGCGLRAGKRQRQLPRPSCGPGYSRRVSRWRERW
eukprot:6211191-Pleurochrysis_carterae.AAC.2